MLAASAVRRDTSHSNSWSNNSLSAQSTPKSTSVSAPIIRNGAYLPALVNSFCTIFEPCPSQASPRPTIAPIPAIAADIENKCLPDAMRLPVSNNLQKEPPMISCHPPLCSSGKKAAVSPLRPLAVTQNMHPFSH